MAKITVVIPPRGFERVRDRLAEILIDEIDNQAQMSYDTYLESVKTVVERTIPVDKVVAPLINVKLATDVFDNKSQGSVDGTATYNIDVYTNGKATPEESGDKISALRLQKLIGMIQYILDNPIYKTLGFAPPFISRVSCGEINIADTTKGDALNTAMGRIAVNVTMNESTALIVPSLIEGYETQVKIDNTSKGYFYQGENY